MTSLENREHLPLTHRISEALKAFLVKFRRMGPAERAEGHITEPISVIDVTPGRAMQSYKLKPGESSGNPSYDRAEAARRAQTAHNSDVANK